MFVEKKKIGNKEYYYVRVSVREGDRVRTKTIAYLGKGTMTKKEVDESIKNIPKAKIESAKNCLKEELRGRMRFLSKEDLKKIKEIKNDFIKKLKTLDKKLLDDMFKDFNTDYVYNTNAIEGNTLTLEETNLLLNENRSPEGKDLREIYDHMNAKEAFIWLLETKPEITTELIIDIHSRLLKNIDKRVGGFRTHNVRVFGASLKTTDAKYVAADMKILLRWYKENKNRLDPLVSAAIFHEKFERIHPFYDGNGRTGRMLLNLMLLRANLPPLIVQNKDRKEYYKVLSVGHKADLTKTEEKYYKEIVEYCYKQLVGTYERVFYKWG